MKVEIKGQVIETFNTAFEATDPLGLTIKPIVTEVEYFLEEKLNELQQHEGPYVVTVCISKFETKDV